MRSLVEPLPATRSLPLAESIYARLVTSRECEAELRDGADPGAVHAELARRALAAAEEFEAQSARHAERAEAADL